MFRLLVVVCVLSGCVLGDNDRPEEPPVSEPPAIERACIRGVVAGNLVYEGADELLFSWGCEGSAVVTRVTERDGAVVVDTEDATFDDQFRELRILSIDRAPIKTVIALHERTTTSWLLGWYGGLSVAFERPVDDLFVSTLVDRSFLLVGDNALRRASAKTSMMGIPDHVAAENETVLVTGKPFASAVVMQNTIVYVTKTGEVGSLVQSPQGYAAQIELDDAGAPQALKVGDVDGDGLDDVVGAAGHLFVRSSKLGTISVLTEAVQAFDLGDIDGDGKLEVVYITADKASVRRVEVRTEGLATLPVLAKGGDALAVGDLDDDHRGDLALVRDLNKPTSRLVIELAAKQ